MSDVSCRMFEFFEKSAEELGFDPEDLTRGASVDLATLQKRSGYVSWEDWSLICERFEAIVGRDQMKVWGARFIEHDYASTLRSLAGLFLSAEMLYQTGVQWLGPVMFRNVSFTVTSKGAGMLDIVFEGSPAGAPMDSWLRLQEGALAAYPRALGLEDAEITSVIEPYRGHFMVSVPTSRTLLSRLTGRAGKPHPPNEVLPDELKQVYFELMHVERELRGVIDNLPDAVVLLVDHAIVFANAAWFQTFHVTPGASLVGSDVLSRVAPRDRDAARRHLVPSPESAIQAPALLHMLCADGAELVIESPPTRVVQFRDQDTLMFVARDVTEREHTITALRRSEATSRALVDAIPDIIAKMDGKGRFLGLVSCPPQMRAEVDALVGWSADDIERAIPSVPTGFAAQVRGVIEQAQGSGEAQTLVFSTTVGEQIREFETRFTALDEDDLLSITRDVTEQRSQERALATQDRLASLGTLAAGVAHEINNPLTYVVGNLDLAQHLLRSNDKVDPVQLGIMLGQAREGADRVAHITRELHAYARPVALNVEVPVDVHEVVQTALRIVGNDLRHRARLVQSLDPVPPVLADKSRLGQVLLNLLVNAADAIESGATPMGEIHLLVRMVGDKVVIEVQDDGPGIDSTVIDHIFEPFFTTKPVGKGTGLGLSICQRFVTDMGGRIEVVQRARGGSTFRVLLPVAATSTAPTPTSVPTMAPPEAARIRILVIDDDPKVATVLAQLLSAYAVTTAEGGPAALDILERDATWDLVLCDVMMPEVNGLEILQRIEASHPQLVGRVVFTTGGAMGDQLREALAQTSLRVLRKPFGQAELDEVVHEVLGAHAEA